MKWKIDKAKKYALEAHGSQKYGDKPYEYHLDKVFGIVCEFVWEFDDPNLLPTVYQVAYLHDVIEDTNRRKFDIEKTFNLDIANLVDNLTDADGANRSERKLKTWHKIRNHEISIFVKLCDRLANVREGGKLDMYRKEHPLFQAALYVPGRYESIWNELNERLV